jgi:hemerythrin
VVVHGQAIKSLSPDDYLLIEKEHSRLERYLKDLRDTCCNMENQLNCQSCSSEKSASCRGQLPSYFYDLNDLVGKHFYNEESIMLSRPNITEDYGYFRNHRQAHLSVMRELQEIVGKCALLARQGHTADAYRQLYRDISNVLDEHDRSFDDPFIQSTIS